MFVWLIFAAALFGLLFRYAYFFQDLQDVLNKFKTGRHIFKYMKTNYTVLDRFLDLVQTQPHKPLIHFKDETYSYQDADELSNKAARVLLQNGRVKEGDTVALFVGNEPIFFWLWLGLVKLGCSAAFLNSNIRSKSLLHCFNCSGAKTLVAAAELQDAVEEVLPSLLEQQVTVFILADRCRTAGVESFKDKMSQVSSEPLPKDLRSHLTLQSLALYVYTSGTTGLPKAAVITHRKLWAMSFLQSTAGVNNKDVVYVSLPLYHVAGFVGLTGALQRGITVVLRSKFSASQFWDDCRKYNVTVILYIGEIMRYLCNTPKVRTACHSTNVKGEPGLLVSEISVRAPFSGYARDLQQTEKKRLHNVLKTGDVYFNTGDLVLIDKDNFIYFQDRVGDTFRWKGENVATTEVADVITLADCIKEASVYGVEVPGQEGRTGMAAVILRDGQMFDSADVFKHIENFLPAYARPRFMRIQSSLEVTGTFKHLKVKLIEEGFNPDKIKDPVYFLDEKEKNYVPLTLDIFNAVTSGKMKI
eukprot:superscaffoldBa00002368_g14042